MPMTPKEIVRLLEQNGFVFVSSSGSHRGTEKNILKLAGLKK